MSTPQKPLKVAALGMQQRTYSSLQLFFNGPCQQNYILVEEKQADITIIDMDGYHASRVFDFHKKEYPDRPAIIISLSDKQTEDTVYVRKPIQLAALTTALVEAKSKIQKIDYYFKSKELPLINEVIQQPPTLVDVIEKRAESTLKVLPEQEQEPQLDSESDDSESESDPEALPHYKPGHTAEIIATPEFLEALDRTSEAEILPFPLTEIQFNPHNPQLLSKLQFDTDQYLLGYFQQAYAIAISEQRNMRVEGPWRPIVILHETREMLVGHNYRHLYAIAAMPFRPEEVAISYVEDDLSDIEDDDSTIESIEPFLWKLAVRTSRGRVPKGTDFNMPIRLLRWPNFTRTSATPHALRIAALWSKQPMSLLQTAEALAIPLHYVFVFYSAALSLDLITIASTTTEKAPQAKPVKPHKHHNIFQFLLKKMRSA